MKKLTQTVLTTGAIAGGAFLFNGSVHADSVQVKSGDTLGEIAQRTHTSVESLVQKNHIADANKIIAGTTLETGTPIKQSNATQGAEQFYIVQKDNTLSDIALHYHTTVANLMALNKLNSDVIYIGQRLQVSGQAPQVKQPTVSQAQAQQSQAQVQQNQSQVQAQQSQSQTQARPAQPAQSQRQAQPRYQAPQRSYQQPQSRSNNNATAGNNNSAKSWIAMRESGGSYNARNGRYVGKYQLDSQYLHGDYSPENQERTADNYVAQRYGTWANAQQHWQQHGWY